MHPTTQTISHISIVFLIAGFIYGLMEGHSFISTYTKNSGSGDKDSPFTDYELSWKQTIATRLMYVTTYSICGYLLPWYLIGCILVFAVHGPLIMTLIFTKLILEI
jgi:hypothetical protein